MYAGECVQGPSHGPGEDVAERQDDPGAGRQWSVCHQDGGIWGPSQGLRCSISRGTG